MQDVRDAIVEKFKDAVDVCQKSGREYTHVKVSDLAELLSRLSGERWVSVEDGLPEGVGRYQVAVRYKDDGMCNVTEALFTGAEWCDSTCDELLNGKVDVYAWRPLPAPPSEPSSGTLGDKPNVRVVERDSNFMGRDVKQFYAEPGGNQPREGREG